MFDEHATQADSHEAAMSAATEQHAAEKAEAQAAHDAALAAAKAEAETLSAQLAEAAEQLQSQQAQHAEKDQLVTKLQSECESAQARVGETSGQAAEAEAALLAQRQALVFCNFQTF